MFVCDYILYCHNVIEGEIVAQATFSICCISVVKDFGLVYSVGEACIYCCVKERVKCLEDRDRTFVCSTWFIDKGASCEFETVWEYSSGEDNGYHLGESVKPVWMHLCNDVEGETFVSRFGRDVSDMFNKVW